MSMRDPLMDPLTRRQYLVIKTVLAGSNWLSAQEAVASTAMSHPDWDMDEVHTFAEWEHTTRVESLRTADTTEGEP